MTRFSFRLELLPSEPLDLLLLRAATVYGLDSPGILVRALGLRGSCRIRRCDLSPLASVLRGGAADLAEVVINARWPRPGTGLVRLQGRDLPSSVLGSPLGRICPQCFDEGTAFRWCWDLKMVVACERHGRMLRDRCHTCERRLDWNRMGVVRCHCGSSLRHDTAVAPERAVTLARTIVESGAVDGATPSYASAAALAWFAAVRADGQVRRGATIDRPDVATSWRLLEPVADILTDWPVGFGNWLTSLRDRQAVSGSLYEHLPVAAELRTVFGNRSPTILDAVAFLVAADGSLPRLRSHSRFHRTDSVSLDARSAASVLGVAPASVARRIKAGTLRGRIGTAGGRRCVTISRTDLRGVALDREGYDAKARRLGISGSQVVALVRVGLLGRSETDGRTVDDMVLELDERVLKADRPEDMVSLGAVPNLRGPGLPHVVRFVLEGKVGIWNGDDPYSPPFVRLVVSREEILREVAGGLSVREVARLLAVSTRLVPLLAAAGCLTSTGVGRRRLGYEDVGRFRSEFTTTRQIAISEGTSTRVILERLSAAGVVPIIASDAARGISSVWRRRDVVTVIGSQVPAPSVRRPKDVHKAQKT